MHRRDSWLRCLGKLQAAALARAGASQFRLIDSDTVEWSSLQRQWLLGEADTREQSPKATAAAAKLSVINSSIVVEALAVDLWLPMSKIFLDGINQILAA